MGGFDSPGCSGQFVWSQLPCQNWKMCAPQSTSLSNLWSLLKDTTYSFLPAKLFFFPYKDAITIHISIYSFLGTVRRAGCRADSSELLAASKKHCCKP